MDIKKLLSIKSSIVFIFSVDGEEKAVVHDTSKKALTLDGAILPSEDLQILKAMDINNSKGAKTLIVDLMSFGDTAKYISMKDINDFMELKKSDISFNERVDSISFFASALFENKYVLSLGSCGNPDYYENPEKAACEERAVFINSVVDGQEHVRQYIDNNDLGGGSWFGGLVFSNKKVVGYYSYNGRLWSYPSSGEELKSFSS